MAFTSEWCHQI